MKGDKLEIASQSKLVESPRTCSDCGAKPGYTHYAGCDVERCSECGGQWISCGHEDHEPNKSFWTGYWPGAEACRQLNFWYDEGDRQTEDLNKYTSLLYQVRR